jgi:hypothetical protein
MISSAAITAVVFRLESRRKGVQQMRKLCACGAWIALSADGIAFDSNSPTHIGNVHEHQRDMADDIEPTFRVTVSQLAFTNGIAKLRKPIVGKES